MNVIARLEYELAYYDSAVHRFNHYTTRKRLNIYSKSVILQRNIFLKIYIIKKGHNYFFFFRLPLRHFLTFFYLHPTLSHNVSFFPFRFYFFFFIYSLCFFFYCFSYFLSLLIFSFCLLSICLFFNISFFLLVSLSLFYFLPHDFYSFFISLLFFIYLSNNCSTLFGPSVFSLPCVWSVFLDFLCIPFQPLSKTLSSPKLWKYFGKCTLKIHKECLAMPRLKSLTPLLPTYCSQTPFLLP